MKPGKFSNIIPHHGCGGLPFWYQPILSDLLSFSYKEGAASNKLTHRAIFNNTQINQIANLTTQQSQQLNVAILKRILMSLPYRHPQRPK
jgi:hypothetical protein